MPVCTKSEQMSRFVSINVRMTCKCHWHLVTYLYTRTTEDCIVWSSASVCDGSPCQNGGTCSVSGGGTADCACVPGYSGTTCTGNGLLILYLVSSYLQGYVISDWNLKYAWNSQVNVSLMLLDSVCDSTNCENLGTCSVVAGAATCACVPGYGGPACLGTRQSFCSI